MPSSSCPSARTRAPATPRPTSAPEARSDIPRRARSDREDAGNRGKQEETMSDFVFLYCGGEAGRPPERAQEKVEKSMTLFKELGKRGNGEERGLPRERSGRLVKGRQKVVTDGPFAETKDVVGGFTLIEAGDLDQAVELSKGCPIFETDGAVEVRPVMILPSLAVRAPRRAPQAR